MIERDRECETRKEKQDGREREYIYRERENVKQKKRN